VNQTQPAVIQRYVSPLLLDGYKFDFRFYVLISSLHPLTIYLYNEGLARFCTHAYAPPTPDTLDDRFCHLTNTAVNVANPENPRPILELASSVLGRVIEMDSRGATLWERIRQVVMLSIVAQYPGILQNVGMTIADTKRDGFVPPKKALYEIHRYFHLLGIDVMINDRCEPVVLELNDRPSMCVTYDLEQDLKSRVVFDALNIVTVDGGDAGDRAIPGGWEKVLPAVGDAAGGRAVQCMVERCCQGALASPKRLVMKRLGYVPASSYSRGPKRVVAPLPPLHQ
jgi:tubulin polyglutamylase TTLL6/13